MANKTDIQTMLRVPEVMRITGLCRATIWRLERTGRFPRKFKLTPKAVGWRESDVTAWIEARRAPDCVTAQDDAQAGAQN